MIQKATDITASQKKGRRITAIISGVLMLSIIPIALAVQPKTTVLTVYAYADYAETDRVCREMTEKDQGISGCAFVRGSICEIHITRPGIGRHEDLIDVGHEVWHCLFGDFH